MSSFSYTSYFYAVLSALVHAVIVFALFLVLSACGSDYRAPTLVTLGVSATGQAERATKVRLRIFQGDKAVMHELQVLELDVQAWPVETTIAPQGGDPKKLWRVQAWGLAEGVTLGAGEVSGAFSAGQHVQAGLVLRPDVTLGLLPPVTEDGGAGEDAGVVEQQDGAIGAAGSGSAGAAGEQAGAGGSAGEAAGSGAADAGVDAGHVQPLSGQECASCTTLDVGCAAGYTCQSRRCFWRQTAGISCDVQKAGTEGSFGTSSAGSSILICVPPGGSKGTGCQAWLDQYGP